MSTRPNEAQIDAIGRTIDRLENLSSALNLPMSSDFHVRQIKKLLPEIIFDLKKHFVMAFGSNPWDMKP